MGFHELMLSLNLGLIYGIVGMGVFLTFKVIDFPDLTCDGSFALGLAVTGIMIHLDYNPYLVIIVSLLSGIIAGAITGVLNAYFKVTDLLAGILVAFMLYSINIRVMREQPNRTLLFNETGFSLWADKVMNPLYELIPSFNFLEPYNHLILLVFLGIGVILFLSWLLNTDLGLSLRAIGQNKRLCQNSGVNVKWMIILGVALGNGFVAVGGSLFGQFTGVADITAGIGTIITGFAAVIIGEKLLPFRSIWIKLFSCIIGSILFHLIKSVALNAEIKLTLPGASAPFFELQAYDFNLIAGIIIILVMAIPGRKQC